MKHLRKFNESFKDDLQDIKDICLEMSDMGYSPEISVRKVDPSPMTNRFKISDQVIQIKLESTSLKSIHINDIHDTLLRIQDFSIDKFDIQIGVMGYARSDSGSKKGHYHLQNFQLINYRSPYNIDSIEKLIGFIKNNKMNRISILRIILIPK